MTAHHDELVAGDESGVQRQDRRVAVRAHRRDLAVDVLERRRADGVEVERLDGDEAAGRAHARDVDGRAVCF